MTMSLVSSRYIRYSTSDFIFIAKKGYAILDSQNVHIKISPSNILTKQSSNDPFLFLLWRVYMRK